jgi:hypothetical protein
MKIRTLLQAAFAAFFFACPALAQNAGTVTNHAFALGKGAGVTGYTSLLCTSAQLAVGQSGADPICRTLSGDAAVDAAGVVTLATVNSNVGSFGSATQCPTLTVNGKGLTTAASATTCTPAVGSVTGLGTGVATFLATPSSANLRAALTDEVGTGAAYFVGGALGTPASGTLTNATGLPVGGIASIAANTMVANATGGSASPTAVAVPSCSGANQALNWTSGTGLGCLTVSGGGSPSTNVQTVDYTITTSDIWKVVQVGTGSTGKKTITMPSTSGFADGSVVWIRNGDTTTRSGKLLSGFPAGCLSTKYMLFPGVTIGMVVVNSNWAYLDCPGPYVPTAAMTLLVDAAGSDSTGDGFTSAYATMQRCISVFEQVVFYTSDLAQPTCQFTSNIVESAVHYYPVPGTNTLNISASSCSFTWKPSGSNIYSLAAGNGGNVQLSCMNLSGTSTTCFSGSGATACTLVIGHNNNVVVETLASVTCTDTGANGVCFVSDTNTAGGLQLNIDNGLTGRSHHCANDQ